MSVPLWIWIATIVVILGFFIFDFYSHVRTPHEPTLKESASWSAFYVGLALLFGVFVYFMWDHQHGMEYFTGYVTEKALSVDNLFVFALIMGAFKIPRKYQQKVLLIGIVLALVFRLAFILAGAAIIAAWSDVFYLFAFFLLWTAIKLLWDEITDAPETDPNDMKVIRWLRKVVPVTPGYHGDKLTTKFHGKFASPRCSWRWWPSAWWTSCSRSTRSRRSTASPPRRTWCSPPTRSRSWVCVRCTSCWTASSTAWCTCRTAWVSSWRSSV